MLWGLKQLKRRIVATGSVQVTRAELFLLCGEVAGISAEFCGDVSHAVRDALHAERLEVYLFGGEWYVAQVQY